MLIALQKKKENIAEYVLYMFQVEDLIRSCDFDIGIINETVVAQYEADFETREKITNWYVDLIAKMKSQKINKSGHLIEVREIIEQLHGLHESLMNTIQDKHYLSRYHAAKDSIAELRSRSGKSPLTDIEICFNSMYGLLLLRLQKKKVTPETMEGFTPISQLLAYLAKKYGELKAGKLSLPALRKN